MQLRTENHSLTIGDRGKPVVSLSIAPKHTSGYLAVGLGIGLLCGLLVGTVIGAGLGDKGMLLAQHLWNRVFGVNADGEKVHFELLLQ